MLKESIADLVIHEHYEQYFLDLEYIFEQNHYGSKISDSKEVSHRIASRSIEVDDFVRGSD